MCTNISSTFENEIILSLLCDPSAVPTIIPKIFDKIIIVSIPLSERDALSFYRNK